jgi:hypothetical protein
MTFSKPFILLLIIAVALACNNVDNHKTVESEDTESNDSLNNVQMTDGLCIDTVFSNSKNYKDGIQAMYESNACQLSEYLIYLDPNLIDSNVISESKNTKSQVVYLGEITDLKTHKLHHVLTDFTIVGINEVLSPKGHTKLIFIDALKEKILFYNLGMPDERPINIRNNQLIFKKDKTEIRISISGGLPLILCIPQIDCY